MPHSITKAKRKSISPIIATLILIVITVVAGIALYGFVSRYMSTLSSSSSAPPPDVIINSAAYSSNGNITLVVTNEGSTQVTFTSATLYSENGAPAGVTLEAPYPENIGPNSQVAITIKPSSSIPSGNYYVTLATSTGYSVASPTFYV